MRAIGAIAILLAGGVWFGDLITRVIGNNERALRQTFVSAILVSVVIAMFVAVLGGCEYCIVATIIAFSLGALAFIYLLAGSESRSPLPAIQSHRLIVPVFSCVALLAALVTLTAFGLSAKEVALIVTTSVIQGVIAAFVHIPRRAGSPLKSAKRRRRAGDTAPQRAEDRTRV